MTRKIVLGILAALAALAILIQLVPYRVVNPDHRVEPQWDSPQTRVLAERACFDCHSNEVKVPWYGHIAPVAWLVRDHVDEGRSKLNFSAWDQPQEEAHEAGEVIQEREMPPAYYTALHPEARLTDAEWAQLVAGLDASLGGQGAKRGGLGGDHDEAGERD